MEMDRVRRLVQDSTQYLKPWSLMRGIWTSVASLCCSESRDYEDSSLDVYVDKSIRHRNWNILHMMVLSRHTFLIMLATTYTSKEKSMGEEVY